MYFGCMAFLRWSMSSSRLLLTYVPSCPFHFVTLRYVKTVVTQSIAFHQTRKGGMAPTAAFVYPTQLNCCVIPILFSLSTSGHTFIPLNTPVHSGRPGVDRTQAPPRKRNDSLGEEVESGSGSGIYNKLASWELWRSPSCPFPSFLLQEISRSRSTEPLCWTANALALIKGQYRVFSSRRGRGLDEERGMNAIRESRTIPIPN